MARVLFVIPGPTYGGAANQVIRLHGALRDRGWESLVALTDEPGNTADRLEAAGVDVVRVPIPRARATRDPRPHLALARGFRGSVRGLERLVRERGVDVVQNHGDLNPHGAVAGRRAGAAVVWQILDTRTPERLRPLTGRLMLRLSDAVTTWGHELGRAYPGVVELGERHIAIFPAIETGRFRPDPQLRRQARDELGIPEAAMAIGAIGNRNPQKGHEWLVRAVARLRGGQPGAVLRILGAASPGHEAYEAELRAEAASLGLEEPAFRIVDPGQRVAELMNAFDVVALGSVPRSEGVPTVLAEAMACAIPVVATDVGAVAELVLDGTTGCVVPPLDADAMAGALARLAGDGALRERLGRAGLDRVRGELSLEVCADRYARAFELAMAHRDGKRR